MDCIISIIEENPESKEAGLAHLCEFIEDCEHTVLATKILHLLGKEGPRTPSPSKYIRFIFNRVVLENEAVRAGEFSSCLMVSCLLEISGLKLGLGMGGNGYSTGIVKVKLLNESAVKVVFILQCV